MTGRVVPDRVRAAVEVVGAGPDTRVLEVGCGPGAAASLVCPLLTGTGRMLATDRSSTAVGRTAERNAAHVASGRLSVRQTALAELDATGPYDVALALNVNLFWTRDPGPELAVLRGVLAAGGRLHVLYGGASPTGAHRTLDVVRSWLRDHGWTTRDVRREHLIGVTARSTRPGHSQATPSPSRSSLPL